MLPDYEPALIQNTNAEEFTRKGGKRLPWRLRPGERILLLLVGDLLAAGLAVIISLFLWAQKDWLNFSLDFLNNRTPAWFFILPLVWVTLLVEIYDSRRATRRRDTLRGIGIAALMSLVLYLLVYFISEPDSLNRRGVAYFIVTAGLLTLVWRMVFIAIFTAPQFQRRVLIVGAGKSGSVLVKQLSELTPMPFHVVGFIDDDPEKLGSVIWGFPVLGGGSCLLDVVHSEAVTDLIAAISGELNGTTFQSLLDAQELGVEVTTMPVVYEEFFNRVPIFLLESDWILRSFVDQVRATGFYELGKRLIDIIVSLVFIVILGVTFPFIALAILLDSGWPIFFTQNRLGIRGQMYNIFKYRTMVKESEKDGYVRVTIDNDERITRVGTFLRRSHIDELPQAINVLLGEMSMVGPRAERAELVNQLQAKIPFYRARLLVKPGITGWAQVNFGYAATVEDTAIKLEYDLFYIKHRSIILDIVILLKTFGAVFGLRGT